MNMPEREPREVLVSCQRMSGSAPAISTFHQHCDQAVSQEWLDPSREAHKAVSNGHGLEISTFLWGATRAKDPGVSSSVLIPMGGRCRNFLDPNERGPRRAVK